MSVILVVWRSLSSYHSNKMQNTVLVAFTLLVVSSLAHGFVCPSDGLFLNPDDQHTFYQCAFGTAHRMPCPAGLVWDQSIHVCEWPSLQGERKCVA